MLNEFIPRGFRMSSKVTYLDEELSNICQDINDNASNMIINEVVTWLDTEIRNLMIKENELKLELCNITTPSDYDNIVQTISTERQRINTTENKRQQRKLDELSGNSIVQPQCAEGNRLSNQPPLQRRRSTFIRGRNRRVNRDSRRRRKSNWIRNADLALLNLLKESENIDLPVDMFHPIELTEDRLQEEEKNVCSLGLKFVPTIKKYDRVKKWLDIQAFKRKIRLKYMFSLSEQEQDGQQPADTDASDDNQTPEPWKPKSKTDVPPCDNQALETFLLNMENDLLLPKNEKTVKDNITRTEREALYRLSKMNKNRNCSKMLRTQDKGSRIVVESKDRYIEKMNDYLNNKEVFREDAVDQSQTYKEKIQAWTEKWKENLSKEEVNWINKEETNPGKVYANIKTHKPDNPYRFIVSANGTAIENLARWIEYHLKDLSGKHKAYLKDTKAFLRYIDHKNIEQGPFEKEKLWMVSRDIVNYYPSCSTPMCIEAVGKLLDTRSNNIPPKECIIEALSITMNSNNCKFLNQHFTQIDGATIGGPESASVTDIYGAVFIDRKIEENIINEAEDWMRYRDDSWSVSTATSLEREEQKTMWMNNNIVKDKIRFTMEASQSEMVFLDTKVSTVESEEGHVFLTTDIYSKKTDTHQYLNPKSCHPENQVRAIPIGVADRIRRNCSDNVEDDKNYKKRLVEYKAYLIKSGHDSDQVDRAFIKRASVKRNDILQKERKAKPITNKTLFVTEYEPSFPSVNAVWRKHEHLIKNDDVLKKVFPNGVKDFSVAFKRGGKNIKEWVASPTLNTVDNDAEDIFTCDQCPNNCVDCNYLRDKGQFFHSTSLKRRFKLRQNVNCLSRNVVYLVTCKKCQMQGVGETTDFKKRMANYRSCIRNGKISCNVDKHFVETDDHSVEDFDVQIICMLVNPPKNKKELRIRLKQFEGYWQVKLCTLIPHGLNSINELEANLKWSHKNVFYPEQDH